MKAIKKQEEITKYVSILISIILFASFFLCVYIQCLTIYFPPINDPIKGMQTFLSLEYLLVLLICTKL